MRADTLELLKQLDAPVYRWPGGNFVSGYNWRDGIGERDRRPPRKNPAWQGIEHNDFGMDEFMVFCRTLGTEPYIAVNAGLGNGRSAVEELQYANAPADRPGGQLRASNGHPQPYGVHWWGIGNEMFGDWQLGYMGLDKYIAKHIEYAKAMRAADPSIKLVAVGAAGPWSEGMLRKCANDMDLMSEHFYCGENPNDLAAHVRLIPDNIRRIAAAHRDYRKRLDSLKGKDIRIAMDEWNYWYGTEPYGQIGCPFHLKDALGIAAGLHEFARQSDIVFMANYAQTVNVIGCIKTSKTAASLDTTGLALKLYRQHFGVTPVAVESPAPLDVAAAWTADRKALTVGIVNPTMKPAELSLHVAGTMLKSDGAGWQIAGPDPMAHNAPGKEPPVKIESLPPPRLEPLASKVGAQGSLTVAPCSVTLLRFEKE
jgi:alpha-N-arabinofuranosidase